MGKGENSQQSSADQMYQQQASQSNAYYQQWMTQFLPEIQKLIPMYQGALSGTDPTLLNAAEAPVNVNTARMLNTIGSNPGMATNKNSALEDIAFSGQQQSGVAADQTLAMAASALQALMGIGSSNAQSGTANLGNAASGEANLGQQISNQDNAWWQSVLGAAGTAYGMNSPGAKQQSHAQAPMQQVGGGPSTSGSMLAFGMPNLSNFDAYRALSGGGGANGTNASTPISQIKSSYVPAPYSGD